MRYSAVLCCAVLSGERDARGHVRDATRTARLGIGSRALRVARNSADSCGA